MNGKQDYYRTLLECYCNDDISREDAEELFEYLAAHPGKVEDFLDGDDYLRFLEKAGAGPEPEGLVSARMYNRLLAQIKKEAETGKHRPVVRNILLHKIGKWRVVAAVVLLVAGVYYYGSLRTTVSSPDTNMAGKTVDIDPPDLSHAYITLSGGDKVMLNETEDGTIADEGSVQVVKAANGEIIYQSSRDTKAGNPVFNTLWNPRGSRVIQMRLSDGTRVWLNAGSSITYPVAFTEAARRVSVTGEAYFEVVHDSAMPFVVNKGETSVTVLGTHFNVNAYEDEEEQEITLLEGSVKIDIPGAECLLKPGQQANISQVLKVLDDVDLDEVMAWKNGFFNFDNSDIYTIMRKVARWYDIEVVYEGNFTSESYIGKISMDTRLSELLEVLELNKVGYVIENKTVKLRPVK